jgi:pimeloyl-ACP methyl ester carboxylesterase
MSTYVLVHGAWHSGDMFAELADVLRRSGHVVHTPTLAGNRPGDSRHTGLEEAIASLLDYFKANSLKDVILLGHSYGGMAITAAADRLPPGAIRRLIYWSAYVPNNGESLEDISPPMVKQMHLSLRGPDGGLAVPSFVAWREFLMNDADIDTATKYHAMLNRHPHQTMLDKITLSKSPAEFAVGKSYIHCQEDVCYPQSAGGWHPRFSERLGLFRLISMPGSHEVCFSNPEALAASILKAGRD